MSPEDANGKKTFFHYIGENSFAIRCPIDGFFLCEGINRGSGETIIALPPHHKKCGRRFIVQFTQKGYFIEMKDHIPTA